MRKRARVLTLASAVIALAALQGVLAGPGRANGNLLDPATATIEGSLGHWVPWFSTTVSQTSEEAHSGAESMQVDITAPHGWGVQLDNWPGFAAAPGPKYLSFWAKAAEGSGPLGANMHVSWHGPDGSVFRTDTFGLASLTGAWQQAETAVIAQPGITTVTVTFSHPSGGPGDRLYLDDIVVADTTNALDETTATIESSTGHWVPWFSSTVSKAGPPVNGGNHSLRIDITAMHGWGVQLDNWPGFAETPGPKTIAFWARAGAGSGPLGATLQARWWDGGGSLLGTDSVTIPLLSDLSGSYGAANVMAPPGTAWVTVEILHASGGPGDHLFVDDILVADRPT